MQWAGNIAKTMTSNGKQFTVIWEMLTAVAVQLKVAWCCWWNFSTFFKICFWFYHFIKMFSLICLFCWITNCLMLVPRGTLNFVSCESPCFPLLCLGETLRFSGSKIHCSPGDQSLSVIISSQQCVLLAWTFFLFVSSESTICDKFWSVSIWLNVP